MISSSNRYKSRLYFAVGLSSLILVLQLYGAWLSGSLALLTDAAHVFTDIVAGGIALIAIKLATRPATAKRSFGLLRTEILAALLNSFILFVLSIYFLIQSWVRFNNPEPISGELITVFGILAITVNLINTVLLHRGSKESLNLRATYLDFLADTLGSVLLLIAGVVIWITNWQPADALASAIIAILMLPRAWSLARESLDVLLEATPKNIDLDKVRDQLAAITGVNRVSDLHIWTITSSVLAISAHVEVDSQIENQERTRLILAELEQTARDNKIIHSTFQINA